MKTKLRKTYNILIRLAVVVFTVVFLYDQFFVRKDTVSLIDDFGKITDGNWLNEMLLIVVLLIPVNLILESIKWKLLIDKLEKVSLLNSVKGVLAGISVSMIMPNRVGDYLGRVFILRTANRIQAVLSTIVGSIAQLLTTLILGLIALVFYLQEYLDINITINFWIFIGSVIVVITTISIIILAYLNFSVFAIVIKRVSGKYYSRIHKYTDVFSMYSQDDLYKVLILSVIRYFVFSFQFFLLLLIFDVTVNYLEAMMLIAIIYFLMTIIPTIALTEIGIRGSISLYVFQHHFESLGTWKPDLALGVVSASSLLWIFNLVVPAIVGTIFVFSLKFFRKNNVS
jgi:lysylphosphatidylglycerol synthase-like protein